MSVIICTRNRLQSLVRSVDALLKVNTECNWELVIVDAGSTDGTVDYLKSVHRTQVGQTGIVAILEPNCGLAVARNLGWRACSGTIIAFTDDDCYVAPDYIRSVDRVFQDDPKLGFMAGRILLFDPQDSRVTINESQSRLDFTPYTFIPAGAIQGANMAFRREVLEAINGFDERLGAGTPFGAEDIDAAAAALWLGIRGAYDPRPLVYHHHGRKPGHETLELTRRYDAGRGAYYAKYAMKSSSRGAYLQAWIKSMARDCWSATRRMHLPRQSLAEFTSAVRFALASHKV